MNKKAYVYISLTCILTLVLSCFSAGAVSVTVNVYPVYSTVNATLTNQYTVDYEMDSTDTNYPYGNYNIATYEAYVPIVASGIAVDSYINGASTGTVTVSPTTPTGATLASRSISFEPYSGDGFWVGAFNFNTSNASIRVMFDNYYSNNSGVLQLGVLHYYVSYTYTATPSNVPDPPPNVSVSLSSSTSSAVAGNPEPEDMGYCHVIETAIVNGLSDNSLPFDDILSILTQTKSMNFDYFSAIVSYLNTTALYQDAVEDWLNTIYSELALNTTITQNIALYTGQLQALMSTFPQYSAQVLTLLGKLADMNATQQSEAAAIESQYDSLQQQQDNANAIVSAVPRPTFSAGQFDGDNLVNSTQRQNFTGFLSLIVGNSYITTIFLIIITFATAGFVLFGKKR